MRYLLDTCVLIWTLNDDPLLEKKFRNTISDNENEIIISVISYWEITVKKSLGKLQIPDDWTDIIEKAGFSWLELKPKHIAILQHLPSIHNDPFDRLLICQALSEKMSLLTSDEKILQYDILQTAQR